MGRFTGVTIAVAVIASTLASVATAQAQDHARSSPSFSEEVPLTRSPLSENTLGGPASEAASRPPDPPKHAQAAKHAQDEFVPGEVIVRFRDDAAPSERRAARIAVAARGFRRGPMARSQIVDVAHGSVERAARALSAQPAVLYAEPNYLLRSLAAPNDPLYPSQWALRSGPGSISAPPAWEITTGGGGPVIAVVDSGMQMDHPDLAPNLWVNPDEIPGNGIDDDGNGFVDDVHGWDWVGKDAHPNDEHGHGTHVSGIAGARGNDGYGVTGLAWGPRVMVLRALNRDGVGAVSDIAAAFSYAASKGARIVNASVGGDRSSRTLTEAITRSPGTLFVTASGNGGSDGVGDNNDIVGSYPCNVVAQNLICVAASNQSDEIASFSNYGATTVHLAAPGTSILSTLPTSRHGYASGTSMATPLVAATAALLWSFKPAASAGQVRGAILAGVDQLPSMSGKLITGGRLNVYEALAELGAVGAPQQPAPSPSPSPSPSPTPTSLLDLPLPSLDPLEPSPSPDPAPETSPTPEPDETDGPEEEPPAELPKPVLADPESMTLRVAKYGGRYRAGGNVQPTQDRGRVRMVLLRKRDGTFKKVARRDVALTVTADGSRSVYRAFFKKMNAGRCRIRARLFTDDGPFKLGVTRTFRC